MKNPRKEKILATLYVVSLFSIIVSIPVGIVWLISDTAHLYWGLFPAGIIGIFIIILLFKSGARETRKTDLLLSTILGLVSIGLFIGGVINLRNEMSIDKCEGIIDYVCVIKKHRPPDTNGFFATLARSTNTDFEYLLILKATPYANWEALGFNKVNITVILKNGNTEYFTCKGSGAFWGETILVSPSREHSWELLECPISLSATDLSISKFDIEITYTYAYRLQGNHFENRKALNVFTIGITR